MIGQVNREGFHTITPYLMVPEVVPVVEFLQQAFQATETFRTTGGAGGTHVEVRIGDSMLMLGGSNNTVAEAKPVSLFLYVANVDAVYQSALDAGATSLMPPADGLFTERRGAGVKDAFGNEWYLAEHERP
jgi:PhnB protein